MRTCLCVVKNLKNVPVVVFTTIISFISGCDSSDELNLCNGDLSLKIVEVLDAVDDSPIGKITVDASGGTEPYAYSIDGINYGTSNIFLSLSAGSYTVSVIDGNECIAEELVPVKAQLVVSYSNQIVPIISANCTIASCHCDGNSLCFDNYETVKANSTGIRDRTSAGAMPPSYSGKKLTENEIKDIANWVYQGARDN